MAIALTAAMSTCAMALTSDQTYNRDIEVRVEDADGLSESEISRVKNGVIAVYLSGEVATRALLNTRSTRKLRDASRSIIRL